MLSKAWRFLLLNPSPPSPIPLINVSNLFLVKYQVESKCLPVIKWSVWRLHLANDFLDLCCYAITTVGIKPMRQPINFPRPVTMPTQADGMSFPHWPKPAGLWQTNFLILNKTSTKTVCDRCSASSFLCPYVNSANKRPSGIFFNTTTIMIPASVWSLQCTRYLALSLVQFDEHGTNEEPKRGDSFRSLTEEQTIVNNHRQSKCTVSDVTPIQQNSQLTSQSRYTHRNTDLDARNYHSSTDDHHNHTLPRMRSVIGQCMPGQWATGVRLGWVQEEPRRNQLLCLFRFGTVFRVMTHICVKYA